MLLISQNLAKYDMSFPEETVFRVNLAWVNNIQELTDTLKKHENHSIFLDLPVGRLKPPNNKYTLNDIVLISQKHNNIKYIAISNVETETDLDEYLENIPKHAAPEPVIREK